MGEWAFVFQRFPVHPVVHAQRLHQQSASFSERLLGIPGRLFSLCFAVGDLLASGVGVTRPSPLRFPAGELDSEFVLKDVRIAVEQHSVFVQTAMSDLYLEARNTPRTRVAVRYRANRQLC
ncbi:MAG: hypothetical protein EXR66_09925 [Dehalococcoidia bacterium]|nr:hypothetical protein [Dehalococcoidia bacterium]